MKWQTFSTDENFSWNNRFFLILSGISFFDIDWLYIVVGHLDNPGFNAITKSSLLESIFIINQEKTPLQMDVEASMLPLWDCLSYFWFLVTECVYCLWWMHCSLIPFDVIFVKRTKMLPVQFVTLCKTCKPKTKPKAISHYLNQWWPRLPTHICVTRPQWVNGGIFCVTYEHYLVFQWKYFDYS